MSLTFKEKNSSYDTYYKKLNYKKKKDSTDTPIKWVEYWGKNDNYYKIIWECDVPVTLTLSGTTFYNAIDEIDVVRFNHMDPDFYLYGDNPYDSTVSWNTYNVNAEKTPNLMQIANSDLPNTSSYTLPSIIRHDDQIEILIKPKSNYYFTSYALAALNSIRNEGVNSNNTCFDDYNWDMNVSHLTFLSANIYGKVTATLQPSQGSTYYDFFVSGHRDARVGYNASILSPFHIYPENQSSSIYGYIILKENLASNQFLAPSSNNATLSYVGNNYYDKGKGEIGSVYYVGSNIINTTISNTYTYNTPLVSTLSLTSSNIKSVSYGQPSNGLKIATLTLSNPNDVSVTADIRLITNKSSAGGFSVNIAKNTQTNASVQINELEIIESVQVTYKYVDNISRDNTTISTSTVSKSFISNPSIQLTGQNEAIIDIANPNNVDLTANITYDILYSNGTRKQITTPITRIVGANSSISYTITNPSTTTQEAYPREGTAYVYMTYAGDQVTVTVSDSNQW